jgi:hypothetical protein
MYIDQWPELLQRKKFTGFEKLPYNKEIGLIARELNDHINPLAKKVVWKYKELLEFFNSNTGEIKAWRSDDERNYY